MIEGKGLGNKKINRVNVSLTNRVNLKLNRLAISCNMKPTTLAGILIEIGLNEPELINKLQYKYNVTPQYKVTPILNKRETDFGF